MHVNSAQLRALLRDARHFGDGQFQHEYGADRIVGPYAESIRDAEIVQTPAGGVFLVEESHWDSKYFGFMVFRVREWLGSDRQDHDAALASLAVELQNRGARLALLRTATEAHRRTHALARQRALLCGCKIMFVKEVGAPRELTVSDVRPYRQEDREALLEIAESAFGQNHFSADPSFPAEAVAGVYKAWASRLLEVPGAVRLVVGHDDRVDGFLSLTIGRPYEDASLPAHGFLDLVATSPSVRRRGAGRKLLGAAIMELARREVPVFYANTMLTNIRAQRLFIGSGFEPKQSLYEWHWWLQERDNDG